MSITFDYDYVCDDCGKKIHAKEDDLGLLCLYGRYMVIK